MLELEEVAHGFDQPLFVTSAPEGSGRLFVVEKRGTIRTLPGGHPFLDIRHRVLSAGPEQGLLGLAFHPRFRDNHYFYVCYTDQSGGNVVSRFRASAPGQPTDPTSEQLLFWQEQPASNHNGGMLTFGPDGFLYIGMGDGGGANDQFAHAQNRQTLLGAVLRINVDQGEPYAIPPDNPFVQDSGTQPEIWLYGLRNPWRFSFDRLTHDLYLGDVGQDRVEAIYVRRAGETGGENWGWPILEGTQCRDDDECDRTGLTLPVVEYDHSLGCAVTGGYVYRGARYRLLQGAYLFGDYCSGRIWTLSQDDSGAWVLAEMLQRDIRISSFGEDEAGELYLTDLSDGVVYRITAHER